MNVRSYIAMTLGVLTLTAAVAQAKEEGPVLAPGKYLCKISKEYKLRECEVKDGGELVIPSDKGHLMGLRGTLAWDKKAVTFTGALNDPRPYTCFRCNEECAKAPDTCACSEVPKDGQTECLAQVITGALKKTKGGVTGQISYKVDDAEYKDKKPTGKFEAKPDKALLVVQPAK